MDASSGKDKIFLVLKIALLQYLGVTISHIEAFAQQTCRG